MHGLVTRCKSTVGKAKQDGSALDGLQQNGVWRDDKTGGEAEGTEQQEESCTRREKKDRRLKMPGAGSRTRGKAVEVSEAGQWKGGWCASASLVIRLRTPVNTFQPGTCV